MYVFSLMHIGCLVTANNQIVINHIGNDFIEPVFQAVFVTTNQLKHIRRHWDLGKGRIYFQCRIRCIDFDDVLIAEHDANSGDAVNAESA